MSEKVLREEIVHPLLEAMGYTHVVNLHGSNERGKDFSYLVPEIGFGDTKLGVCQVKNSAFTGKSTSSANTTAILNQLDRCRNTTTLNYATSLLERPQRVMLLTTYDIPDKDIAGCDDLLKQLREHCVELVGPHELVEALYRYLPASYSKLLPSSQSLANAMNALLEKHTEHAAFSLSAARNISTFFVNISIKAICPLFNQLLTHPPSFIEDSFKEIGTVKAESAGNVLAAQAGLADALGIPRLLALVDKYGKDITPDTANGDSLSYLYDRSPNVYIRRPTLRPFRQAVLSRLKHSRNADVATDLTENVLCLSASEQLMRFLCECALDSYDRTTGEHITREQLQLLLAGEPIKPGDRSKSSSSDTIEFKEVSPAVLALTELDLFICGQAGAGKSTLAKMVAVKANNLGRRVVYFPCSHLTAC